MRIKVKLSSRGQILIPEVVRESVRLKSNHSALLEVKASILLDALDIIEEQKLRPRDAFHAAIMRNLRQVKIVSDDSDFDRVPWITRNKNLI